MTKHHRHREKTCSAALPFVGPLGRRQNPRAHDGVSYVLRCRCGAEKRQNVNGVHTEKGEWIEPEVRQ